MGLPVLSLFSLRLYEPPGGNQVDGLPPVQHAVLKDLLWTEIIEVGWFGDGISRQ